MPVCANLLLLKADATLVNRNGLAAVDLVPAENVALYNLLHDAVETATQGAGPNYATAADEKQDEEDPTCRGQSFSPAARAEGLGTLQVEMLAGLLAGAAAASSSTQACCLHMHHDSCASLVVHFCVKGGAGSMHSERSSQESVSTSVCTWCAHVLILASYAHMF